jgi:hypothetical protein
MARPMPTAARSLNHPVLHLLDLVQLCRDLLQGHARKICSAPVLPRNETLLSGVGLRFGEPLEASRAVRVLELPGPSFTVVNAHTSRHIANAHSRRSLP